MGSLADYTEFFRRHLSGIVPQQDGQWKALCRFHDDKNPSFHINPETGLWRCYACNTSGNAKQFAERLGLEFPDGNMVNPPPPKKAANPWQDSEIEKLYNYLDEKDSLLYQIVRFKNPKDFRQRRPFNGKWVYNLKDVRRVLYQLPTIEAAPLSEIVFIVEGEKDVETLGLLGKCATTVDGAMRQNPTREILSPLAKRRVVILQDNDAAGKAFADKIQSICRTLCLTVQRLELPECPEKEDVTWWIENGHTDEELDRLVDSAPIVGGTKTHEPIYTKFSDFKEKPVDWLWYPYIPLGRLTMLEGNPGQGKSWFSLATAASVTQGIWPFEEDEQENRWDEPLVPLSRSLSTPGSVLYITCEDDPEDTIVKRLRIVGADTEKVFYVHGKKAFNSDDVVNISLGDVDLLAEMIRDLGVKLVIVDPIQAYLPDSVDMNSTQKVRPLMMSLQRLAAETATAIFLIRHLNKGTGGKSIYRGSGSIDFIAAVRSGLICSERAELAENNEGAYRREFGVAQVKNNIASMGRTISFELRRDVFNWLGLINLTSDELLDTPPISPPGALTDNTEQLIQARIFLETLLEQGPVGIKEAIKGGKEIAISVDALTTMRDEMKLEITRNPITNAWSWKLPDSTEPTE